MSDLDLDELRAELDDFAAAGEEGRPLRRARSASSPASRKSSGLSRSMAAPRSTAKIATSSSGFMPCASTACARLRNAARCSRRSIIRGCWRAAAIAAAAPSETMDDDELLAELEGAAGASDITELAPRPHQRRQARRRGNRQSREVRGLRDVQAALRAGAAATSKPASAQTRPVRARRPKSRPGQFFIVGGQIAYVAEVGEMFSNAARANGRRLRVIYRQRHREQSAACAPSSARFTRTRRDGASPIPSPGHCSPTKARTTIWQAARSMCCAASPTIRSSRPTATFCTRSA